MPMLTSKELTTFSIPLCGWMLLDIWIVKTMGVHASHLIFGLWILKKENEKKKSKVCENKVGQSGIEKFSGTPGQGTRFVNKCSHGSGFKSLLRFTSLRKLWLGDIAWWLWPSTIKWTAKRIKPRTIPMQTHSGGDRGALAKGSLDLDLLDLRSSSSWPKWKRTSNWFNQPTSAKMP